MVGEVCENDEKAGIYQKLDTVRITTSTTRTESAVGLTTLSNPYTPFILVPQLQ